MYLKKNEQILFADLLKLYISIQKEWAETRYIHELNFGVPLLKVEGKPLYPDAHIKWLQSILIRMGIDPDSEASRYK